MSKELSPLFKLRNYILDNQRSQNKNFLGKVLTIIDASITDSQQRKGIKDLIQNEFYRDFHLEEFSRKIILEFSKKYCKDLEPKTNEEESAFMCRGLTPSEPFEQELF